MNLNVRKGTVEKSPLTETEEQELIEAFATRRPGKPVSLLTGQPDSNVGLREVGAPTSSSRRRRAARTAR